MQNRNFTGIQLTPIFEYCLAVSYRLAYSERVYLASLAVQIRENIGDSIPLNALGPMQGIVIPDGGHRCKPILQTLFEALALKVEHKAILVHAASLPDYFPDSEWLMHPSVFSNYNFGLVSISVPEVIPCNLQKCVLTIFSEVRKLQDDSHIFAAKAAITLGEELSQQVIAPRN